jgi:hypothetical protein
MTEKEDARKVTVFIGKEYETLREALQGSNGQIFKYGYELVAFAAALGWENGLIKDRATEGYSVPIAIDSKEGTAVLADIIGALESGKMGVNDSEVDPIHAVKVMEKSFSERCQVLSGYAACGFAYIKAKKDQDGGSYEDVVLEIVEEGSVDKSLLDPLGGLI